MRWFKVNEVNAVLVLLHGVTLSTLLLTGAVIIQSYLCVPRCRDQYVLLVSPIVETTDIIFVSLLFLTLLELLHLGSILDVD